MAEITRGTFLPRSVVNTLHYYILLSAKNKEIKDLLERENISFFIKTLLRDLGYNVTEIKLDVKDYDKNNIRLQVKLPKVEKTFDAIINLIEGELIVKVDTPMTSLTIL